MSSAKNTNKTRMAQRTQKTKEMEEEKIKMKKSCSNNAIKLFVLIPVSKDTHKQNKT
jgi:hypothetical protein